ncbi:MAG: hypothetical protein ACI8XG_001486, partial [Congregibacter sp.]
YFMQYEITNLKMRSLSILSSLTLFLTNDVAGEV